VTAPVFRVNAGGSASRAINIELWGFRRCKLARPLAIAQALQLVPAHHLEGLKKIAYEERALVPGLTRWVRLPRRSRHRGRYDQDEQAITLHWCRDREELFHALFHELGHFVYFRILSSYDKKHWVTEVHRRDPPVSAYGRRNAAEDFAEAYAFFVRAPGELAERGHKYRFMRETVFKDRGVDQTVLKELVAGNRVTDRDAPLDQRV
jgi:hypothetical protein